MKNVDKQITDNKYLVNYVINKYFPSKKNDEDIFQIGLIALWKAIVTDTSSLASFKTYAITCIKNQIITELKKEYSLKRKLNENISSFSFNERCNNDEKKMTYEEVIGQEDDYSNIIFKEYYFSQTNRRKDILKLIDKGYSVDEIAKILNISSSTIYQERKKMKGELKHLC